MVSETWALDDLKSDFGLNRPPFNNQGNVTLRHAFPTDYFSSNPQVCGVKMIILLLPVESEPS